MQLKIEEAPEEVVDARTVKKNKNMSLLKCDFINIFLIFQEKFL
jgi:hypothetical protein